MTERTEWDEKVDEAIEHLIADDTEAFALVAIEDDNAHLIKASSTIDHELLPIFLLVEEVRMWAEQAGKPMTPIDILLAAGTAADRRGFLSGDVSYYERDPP